MHHLAVESYLFQRKMVVRELNEEDPHTYTSLLRYNRVYVGLKKSSGARLSMKRAWYGSDRDHLAQVQGDHIFF